MSSAVLAVGFIRIIFSYCLASATNHDSSTEHKSVWYDEDSRTCFALSVARLSWSAASGQCQRLHGGRLAVVTSAEELSTVGRMTTAAGYRATWVGGRREATTWQWLDGTLLGSFTAWLETPSNTTGADCVAMTTVTSSWRQRNCGTSIFFICRTGARSTNCSKSSVCHDVIQLVHYDTCFLVCRSRHVSWLTAADLCRSLSAELTPLFIADVHDALIDSLRTLHHAAAEPEYWIGLRKARWVWNATGSEMRPDQWAAGEPLDTDSRDCAVLSRDVTTGLTAWRTYNCDTSLPFVCQFVVDESTNMSACTSSADHTAQYTGSSHQPVISTTTNTTSAFKRATTSPPSERNDASVMIGLAVVAVLLVCVLITIIVIWDCFKRRRRAMIERSRAYRVDTRPPSNGLSKPGTQSRPDPKMFVTATSSMPDDDRRAVAGRKLPVRSARAYSDSTLTAGVIPPGAVRRRSQPPTELQDYGVPYHSPRADERSADEGSSSVAQPPGNPSDAVVEKSGPNGTNDAKVTTATAKVSTSADEKDGCESDGGIRSLTSSETAFRRSASLRPSSSKASRHRAASPDINDDDNAGRVFVRQRASSFSSGRTLTRSQNNVDQSHQRHLRRMSASSLRHEQDDLQVRTLAGMPAIHGRLTTEMSRTHVSHRQSNIELGLPPVHRPGFSDSVGQHRPPRTDDAATPLTTTGTSERSGGVSKRRRCSGVEKLRTAEDSGRHRHRQRHRRRHGDNDNDDGGDKAGKDERDRRHRKH